MGADYLLTILGSCVLLSGLAVLAFRKPLSAVLALAFNILSCAALLFYWQAPVFALVELLLAAVLVAATIQKIRAFGATAFRVSMRLSFRQAFTLIVGFAFIFFILIQISRVSVDTRVENGFIMSELVSLISLPTGFLLGLLVCAGLLSWRLWAQLPAGGERGL